MAKVVIENLLKVYPEKTGPGVRAVNGINLTIEDREFMVLVGPSGCGKTTTLRMIAGLEEISGGTIAIDGQVVNRILPKDRDIAMVFQNYALYPHMSVYDNMAFGLKLRKLPKGEIDARVREAAAMLGLENHLQRKPKALSGGQRHARAVGPCIVRKPKVSGFLAPAPRQRQTPSQYALRPFPRHELPAPTSQLVPKCDVDLCYPRPKSPGSMTLARRRR